MAKTRSQKEAMLSSYKDRLSNATGIIMLSQTGLTPGDINDFKLKLSELNGTYNVVKNTIFKIALSESKLPELDGLSTGPNSVVFTSEDVAATAKLITEFIKQHKDKVTIRGGILDGQSLTIEQVKELSELPTKEQSIAMIAGILQQNITGIAYVLQDSVQSIAIILDKAFTENE